jgi:hypothetical protein
MNRIFAATLIALALCAPLAAHQIISQAAGMAKFDLMERVVELLKDYGKGPDAVMAKSLALLGTPCQIAFVSMGISIEERALGKAKDPAAEAADSRSLPRLAHAWALRSSRTLSALMTQRPHISSWL